MEPRRLEIVVSVLAEDRALHTLRFQPGTCFAAIRKRIIEVLPAPGSKRAVLVKLYSTTAGRYLSSTECESGAIVEPGVYTAPCVEIDEEFDAESALLLSEEDQTWPMARVAQPGPASAQVPIMTRQGTPAAVGALVVILGVTVIVLLVVAILLLI